MKIIVDEETEKIYLKRFNISIDKVIYSIENPDRKKVVDIQNFKLIYIQKKFDNYYLLINGRIDTDTEIKIDRVFIISEHFLKNISIENPLEIIELFVKEFGYQLEIANHTGKFIQNVKLKILASRHTSIKKKILYNTLITDDDGRLISGTGLLSLGADSKIIDGIEYIDIFFFYCISLNKYMYYLKTNKLI